ncbi:A49-like RNA polymerase I associated factor [Gracilaria domingensis]|nr:A49-like RNA polymerase I associated factor [Gracilaria domingensis]
MSSEQAVEKFVHVTEVIPFDEEISTLTYPNLISVASGAKLDDLDNISLRPMKRRRVISDDEVQISVDMFGKVNDREMVASRGHLDLNYDYFIGIRDKKTGSTKLVEVDGMYSLRPAAPCDVGTMNDKEQEEDEKEMTYAEKRAELLQSFGGKKSVLRMKKYQRDRITDEKVEQQMAETITMAAKSMRERDTEQGIVHGSEETTESLAPPHNSAATDPKDAYPLLGLLSAAEIVDLDLEATTVIESPEGVDSLENPGWHSLVWDIVRSIVSKDEPKEVKVPRVQAVMHLHYLLVLANAPTRVTREAQDDMIGKMGVEDEVFKCLLERYTSATDRKSTRTKSKLDSNRIIAYATIMWLTALGFKNCMRLGELSAALGINITVLLRAATNLGCKIRKQKDQTGPDGFSLTLKVPLTFPRLKKKYQRK